MISVRSARRGGGARGHHRGESAPDHSRGKPAVGGGGSGGGGGGGGQCGGGSGEAGGSPSVHRPRPTRRSEGTCPRATHMGSLAARGGGGVGLAALAPAGSMSASVRHAALVPSKSARFRAELVASASATVGEDLPALATGDGAVAAWTASVTAGGGIDAGTLAVHGAGRRGRPQLGGAAGRSAFGASASPRGRKSAAGMQARPSNMRAPRRGERRKSRVGEALAQVGRAFLEGEFRSTATLGGADRTATAGRVPTLSGSESVGDGAVEGGTTSPRHGRGSVGGGGGGGGGDDSGGGGDVTATGAHWNSADDAGLSEAYTRMAESGWWADGEDANEIDWGVLLCPCCPSRWGAAARRRWELHTQQAEAHAAMLREDSGLRVATQSQARVAPAPSAAAKSQATPEADSF
ncbi:unnamed protein product [Symbiodinium sp. KB8]|nr:unnamed protein product [Symbiodinium sp. KB8]